MALSYQPYGEELNSVGNDSTSYGFTGEMADPSGMLYLRARYYSDETGRFLTRDTWDGNENQPMSYDLWNYVQSNPVNHKDPSGRFSLECATDDQRIATAKKVVPNTKLNDYMNTYTAVGIAVQCSGMLLDIGPIDDYNGQGYGQISKKQAETPYGEPVKDHGVRICVGNLCWWLREPSIRGYGLCLGESDFRPTDADWSAEYMRRRIQMVVDECKDKFCKDRDKFIVAALAQNGPGFTKANIGDLKGYLIDSEIQWKEWYKGLHDSSKNEYRTQWNDFYRFAKKLNDSGYFLPPNVLNDEMMLWLKRQ